MKNALMKQLKDVHRKGVEEGVLYYTCLMTLAIHNLYGWKGRAFDKIEAEMKRIDAEMKSDDIAEKSAQLIAYILRIRGENYFKE